LEIDFRTLCLIAWAARQKRRVAKNARSPGAGGVVSNMIFFIVMAINLGAFFATPNPDGWDGLIATDSQTHFRLVVEVLLKCHASVHETLSSPPWASQS
jgi:hypothetical protein